MATTVRVDERLHSELRELSNQENRPIGEVTADAIERYQNAKFWEQARADLARLRSDPEEWADYQAEIALWDTLAGVIGSKQKIPSRPRAKRRTSMSNLPEIEAGETRDICFDQVVGREQGDRRPALVVSTGDFDELENGLGVDAPITGRNRNLNLHVPIVAPEGGLDRDSVVMCDRIKSVSILQFNGRTGTVAPATLERVRAITARTVDRQRMRDHDQTKRSPRLQRRR